VYVRISAIFAGDGTTRSSEEFSQGNRGVSLAKERSSWRFDAERGRFVNVFLRNRLLLPHALSFPGTILTPQGPPDFRSPSHVGKGPRSRDWHGSSRHARKSPLPAPGEISITATVQSLASIMPEFVELFGGRFVTLTSDELWHVANASRETARPARRCIARGRAHPVAW